MLDVSRDRVPTLDTLGWLIDVLSALRYNELQLYVEHTFAYAGHDEVWAKASPFTPTDMAWIDQRCADSGIDLVANMNGFGHMGRWLCHDRYRSMAECPDGFMSVFGDGHQPPGSFAPTIDNAAFAVKLAEEIVSSVRHSRINIGGDEPFELGLGRSAAIVKEQGRDRVYVDHLRRIIDPLVEAGHEVMFWGDLFRRDMSLMADIPDEAVGIVWNYEAPGRDTWMEALDQDAREFLGIPDDADLGFESHARLFVDSGEPFWISPGTGSWNSLIGRNRNAAANIADAVEVGVRHGALGILLTDWGDNGHWQPLAVSLPSIVRCGVAAWNGAASENFDPGPAIDALTDAVPGTGALLDRLGSVGEALGTACLNGTAIFDACVDRGWPVSGDLDRAGFEKARETVADATRTFVAGPFEGERGSEISAELSAICLAADIGLRRIGAGAGLECDEPSDQEMGAMIDQQRAAWLSGSRPGGLEDSIARFRT